jgi:Rrf2 family protein
MKLLTKNTDYAVRALLHAASLRRGFASSSDISRAQGIPLRFLRTILRRLAREGYLEAREGVKGGVRLAKEPRDIRLLDLVGIFQGELQLSECLFRRKLCPNRPACPLRRRLRSIESLISREFEGITLSDLREDPPMEGDPPRQ